MNRLRKLFDALRSADRIAAQQEHHQKAIRGLLERERQRGSKNAGHLTRDEIQRYVKRL